MCCSLKENINKFAEAEKLTLNEIAELAEMTLDELKALESGGSDKNILYAFCVHLKLDLNSIYSDEGFKGASLADQYAAYPNQLKKMVSRFYCKQLIKLHCAGSETQFRMLLKPTKLGQPVLARIMSGNSAFSPADLDVVFKGMSTVVPEKECKLLLARCMYSLIPNYNLNQLHDYFKVSYNKIAEGMKVSTSAVGNWGGLNGVPIPDIYWSEIAAKFGYKKHEFAFTVLNATDFKKKSFIEAKVENKPEYKKEVKSKDDLSDINLVQPKKKMEPTSAVSRDSLLPPPNLAESRTASVFITSEIALKMYKMLNDENVIKVNQLISDLFFAQL